MSASHLSPYFCLLAKPNTLEGREGRGGRGGEGRRGGREEGREGGREGGEGGRREGRERAMHVTLATARDCPTKM